MYFYIHTNFLSLLFLLLINTGQSSPLRKELKSDKFYYGKRVDFLLVEKEALTGMEKRKTCSRPKDEYK
jgi:hypothetical protein